MTSNIIREILCQDVIHGFNGTNGSVSISESNPGSKFNPTVVWGIDGTDTCVFRLDIPAVKGGRFKYKSDYLKPGVPGIHGGCDYVIFTKYNGLYYVLFCECKSDQVNRSEVTSQLKQSKAFWDYLVSLMMNCKELKGFNCKVVYVLFSTKGNKRKQTTNNRILRVNQNDIEYLDAGNPHKINLSKLVN